MVLLASAGTGGEAFWLRGNGFNATGLTGRRKQVVGKSPKIRKTGKY
jgi:hypothetical protein